MISSLITYAPPEAPAAPAIEPASQSTIAHYDNPVRRGPILLALHGRESSRAAISTTQLLSDRLGLDVRIVTVTGPVMKYAAPLDIMPDPRTRHHEFDLAHEKVIRGALRRALGHDDTWPIAVRHGQPAREIVRAAEEIDATMVIVDAAPRRGIRRTVAGVRAIEVLRRAQCPVLAVSEPLSTLPQSVVAAVDFSPASIRAVHAALLLIDEGATLTLAHVPLPLYLDHPYRDRSGALIGGDVEKLLGRVQAEIRQFASPRLVVQTRVLDGGTVEAIATLAKMQGADLIVAGTHGPKRIERFFVGSTAASLLHLAPCAVLISPAPAAGERVRLDLQMSDTTVA